MWGCIFPSSQGFCLNWGLSLKKKKKDKNLITEVACISTTTPLPECLDHWSWSDGAQHSCVVLYVHSQNSSRHFKEIQGEDNSQRQWCGFLPTSLLMNDLIIRGPCVWSFQLLFSCENRSDDLLGLVEAGLISTDFQAHSSSEPSILESTFNSVQASWICILPALKIHYYY